MLRRLRGRGVACEGAGLGPAGGPGVGPSGRPAGDRDTPGRSARGLSAAVRIDPGVARSTPAQARARPGVAGPVWNRFQYSSPIQSEFIRAGRRCILRLRAGTRSCGPGPPVYDYRGRGAPSHCWGRIHPYVRSCSATGTDRDRRDWRT